MGPSEGYVATITEPTRQGGIVSIYYLGTLIGCLLGGVAGDRYMSSIVYPIDMAADYLFYYLRIGRLRSMMLVSTLVDAIRF